MNINGLTHQRIETQIAPPSAPVRVPALQPPDPVEIGADRPAQLTVDSIVSRSRDNIRSGSRVHVDQATDRFVVEIVNAKNEVIRQIPPEEALRLNVLFQKITGIIFDQKV